MVRAAAHPKRPTATARSQGPRSAPEPSPWLELHCSLDRERICRPGLEGGRATCCRAPGGKCEGSSDEAKRLPSLTLLLHPAAEEERRGVRPCRRRVLRGALRLTLFSLKGAPRDGPRPGSAGRTRPRAAAADPVPAPPRSGSGSRSSPPETQGAEPTSPFSRPLRISGLFVLPLSSQGPN